MVRRQQLGKGRAVRDYKPQSQAVEYSLVLPQGTIFSYL